MNFDYVPFLSLLENIVDNRGKTCPTAERGIPLIATNCVLNTHLYPVFEKVRYVDEETYQTWFRDHPKPGDMLFVTKGTPGRICWVPDPIDFCIAQDMVAIRANKHLVYPKYLFALLRSPTVQKMIENLHVGTLIPHFKKGDFDKLLLPIPHNYQFQEKVGDLYFDICDKIELNRQTSTTLEAITQAIFKEWFVNFNFPDATGEMIESDLGMIPKGWTVNGLGRLCQNTRNTIHPKDVDPFTVYIGLEHISRKSLGLTAWGISSEVESQKMRFKKYDILFGKLRPYFHKVCIAPIDGICSTDILVIEPKKSDFFSFCLNHLFSNALIAYVSAIADGTRMPRVDWNSIGNYNIVTPPEDLLVKFNEISFSFYDQIVEINQQSITLATIRDNLLRKLMSGEIET